MKQELFRQEVVEKRLTRLYGEVSIAIPLSWQIISLFFVFVILVTIIFLLVAQYPKVQVAQGVLVPEIGLPLIVPSRPGVVTAVKVREGEHVSAGTELLTVRVEEDRASGKPSVGEVIEDAVAEQDAGIASQANEVQAAAIAQVRQLLAQQAGLRGEVTQLESQIRLQRELIKVAEDDLERVRVVAERGFISRSDLQSREESLLVRQQGLAGLLQSLASKKASITEATRTAAQVEAQQRAQVSALTASRAEIAQKAADTAGSRSYAIRSPIDGIVSSVSGRIGQSVNAETPLMAIVPRDSKLTAELKLPSSGLAFVRPGQEVRLAIDAFPYQRYGTIKAFVSTVASSATVTQSDGEGQRAYYNLIVRLPRQEVSAYGRTQALVPGMTLTGRIITDRQSLFEWLFDPLYAAIKS